MISSETPRKPHVVCVPFPAQGHINPFMQLAKIFHCKGFHITFVNTDSNHRRLVQSLGPNYVKGLSDFRFETIPDSLPPSDRDANPDVSALCDSTRKNLSAPFKELVIKLNSSKSSDVPPVSCIISDGVMSFAIKVAEELGIPEVQFWTASACGFMGYLQFRELVNRGIIPFKDNKSITDSALDMPIEWIPGMKNIRLRDMSSFIRTINLDETMFDFMGSEVQNCLRSSAIILLTFQEFEHEVIDAIKAKFPNIYNIGPLPLLGRQVTENQFMSLRPSLWEEDSNCLNWLDKWEPNSVVYVNYGSWTVITEHYLREFAWGLANSKHPFLWIIRPDVVMGESAVLPKEFSDEIKERGYITSWCPQDRVLAHPSVGVFLTHCGWNSMTEALCGGVPIICWPFFAEQQMNCRYACTTWRIGMEVNHDVKRDEIGRLVQEMLEGDKATEVKERVLEWRKKAVEATDIGGSSYNDFNRLLREVLHYE